MKAPSRSDVPFLLAVAALWLPIPGLFLPTQYMMADYAPPYIGYTTIIHFLCLLFYLPALLLDCFLGGGSFNSYSFVFFAAQSALLTWALFRWRARRAARLRAEGEAAKVDP